MKESEQNETPGIVDEINAGLKPAEITVQSMAEKLGINEKTLMRWLETDSEFTESLEIIKEVQENDPFKTGTVEDAQIEAAIVALLLLETKDRHYKPHNL